MVYWQTKKILKSSKEYQKPSWLGNRPKGMDLKEWQEAVKEFKNDKLLILDKLPKKKTTNTERKTK